MIACVVIAPIAAGVECHIQPTLNRQPVILMDYTLKRANMIACSGEAAFA